MVLLHVGLLVGCLLEVDVGGAPFLPWLGWPMLVLVVLAQSLRWWCIKTLGHQWNSRVVVVPSQPLVRKGPYAHFRHPNYVAVVVEGFALPLVHTAWITASIFTVANALLLRVRSAPRTTHSLVWSIPHRAHVTAHDGVQVRPSGGRWGTGGALRRDAGVDARNAGDGRRTSRPADRQGVRRRTHALGT